MSYVNVLGYFRGNSFVFISLSKEKVNGERACGIKNVAIMEINFI